MRSTLATLALTSSALAVDLQPASMMAQLFSQQKNIVGMAEVLSKRFDDRKIEQLSQVSLEAGETAPSTSQIMAESEARAASRLAARKRTDLTDSLAECALGAFIMFFALFAVYKTEQRKARVDTLLFTANETIKEVRDISNPQVVLNNELVYVSGITKNEYGLEDAQLGIQTENAAKLVRKVEMYQWKPFFDGKDQFGTDLIAFRKVWSEKSIGSSKNPIGYLNPQELPIRSEVFHSRSVTLGGFTLAQQQIDQMTSKKFFVPSGDEEQNCLQKLSEIAQKRNYRAPRVQGNYIVMKKKDTEGFNVGDVRISFCQTSCGPLSLAAQQVQDNDKVYTFRAWNPEDVDSKFGNEKSAVQEKGFFAFTNNLQAMVEEPMSRAELLQKHQSKLTSGSAVSSSLSLAGLFIGLFLIAGPTYLFVQQAPIVNFLQKQFGEDSIYAICAIYAIGLFCLINSLAWIKQRPVYAFMTLLVAVSVVYFSFFFEFNPMENAPLPPVEEIPSA